MVLDPETLKYLGVTAVLAQSVGLRKQATMAAEAALAAVPDNVDVQLLAGIVKLGVGETDAGVKLLRDKVLAADPNRSSAKAYLGLAYHQMGLTSERNKLAQQVIDANDDPDAVQLTKSYMEAPAA